MVSPLYTVLARFSSQNAAVSGCNFNKKEKERYLTFLGLYPAAYTSTAV